MTSLLTRRERSAVDAFVASLGDKATKTLSNGTVVSKLIRCAAFSPAGAVC